MVSLFSPPQDAPSSRDTQRVVLHNISWQTYQALLADMGNHRSSRLAYDLGVLEIIMPSDLHEFIKHLLERIIIALTEELNGQPEEAPAAALSKLNLKVLGIGSVTLDREDFLQGVEPDSGFYIQNASRIRGRELDLVNNPPPDLVVEVDITSSSTRRLSIYKQLQVSEVWRCTAQAIEIKHFQNGEYVSREYSLTFPMVSVATIQQFLEQGKDTDDDNEVVR